MTPCDARLRFRRAAAVGLLLGGLLPAASARAAGIDLTWNAPGSCPDSAAVLREIAHLDPAPAPDGTVVRAQVTEESEHAWSVQLRIQVGSQQGERVLHAESCMLLAQAAALVVALALHSEAAPVPPVTQPEPEPTDESLHRLPVGSQARPEANPRGERAHFLLRPLVAGDVGVLPGPSVAFGLAVGLRYGALRFELAATYGLSRTQAVPSVGPGAMIRIQTPIVGQARGCYGWHFRRLEADACIGVEAADLTGTASGITSPQEQSTLWLGVFAGGGLGVRLIGPLSVRLDVEIGVNAVQATFQINDTNVFRPGLVYGRLIPGLELEWP